MLVEARNKKYEPLKIVLDLALLQNLRSDYSLRSPKLFMPTHFFMELRARNALGPQKN